MLENYKHLYNNYNYPEILEYKFENNSKNVLDTYIISVFR